MVSALPKQGFHLEAQRTKPFPQCGWGEPPHQYSFYPRNHFGKSLAWIKTAWSINGPESLSPTHQFKVGIHIQTWTKHLSQALKGSFIKGYSSLDWREIEPEREGQDKGERESHHCLKLASIKQKAWPWCSALSPFGRKEREFSLTTTGPGEVDTDQTHSPDTALAHELKPRGKWRWPKSADYQIINGKLRYAGGCICAH